MSFISFRIVSTNNVFTNHLWYLYKKDLALNNLQCCYAIKLNQTNKNDNNNKSEDR